jgi:hypothetical protein
MSAYRKTLVAGFATLALASLATVTFSTDAEAQRRWRGRGHGAGGAVAAGVIGGLALGAIAAQAAQPRPPIIDDGCYKVRRRVWSDYHGAWVVRRVTVCD